MVRIVAQYTLIPLDVNCSLKTGKTDRLDLGQYYPFIACMAQANQLHPDIPPHPALTHQILNTPSPGGGELVDLPNGIGVKLVLLGDEITLEQVGTNAWWPTGPSDQVRAKLMRRILGEGLLLPSLLSTVLGLVSEMYTTTALPRNELTSGFQNEVLGTKQRVRLSYEGSPISDIGIVHGSVRVVAQDRLAYYNVNTDEFLMGGVPEDHYWMYFKTLAGYEYFLDCGMFTYNCCIVVHADPYIKYGFPLIPPASAFFYNRDFRKAIPLIDMVAWKPHKHVSILRDTRLFDAFEHTNLEPSHDDIATIFTVMDEIAGRSCSKWEKEMLLKFIPDTRKRMRFNLQHREYLNFPSADQVPTSIDTDPDETIRDGSQDEDKAFDKYLRKWARKLKKGQISPERWIKVFGAWKDKPYEARMRMISAG